MNLRRKIITAISHLEKPLFARGILPVKYLYLPDFLGIGTMKSGTTWLYENLKHHPEIYLPEEKETYYFSFKFYHHPMVSYSRKFKDGAGLKKGDITPGYSIISKDRIHFIRRIMPNARLILLLRNPIERSWSEAYMNLVVKPKRSFESINEDEFYNYLGQGQCYERSNYVQIIDNWLSEFPEDQLLICLNDEIKASSKELLGKVFDFIGVTRDIEWEKLPYNKIIIPKYENYGGVHRGQVVDQHSPTDKSIPYKYRVFLDELYKSELDKLIRLYNLPVEHWCNHSI